tara:strand:+ start:424 stop:2919 length:2496 start_codon:yes stop_codon:yes gene_type:complete
MLLLKADTKYDKKLRTAIGKLEGEQKKKFDEEVEKRMEAWTRDYIAGKTAPFIDDIISGRIRIPPEYQKQYDKIKDTIKEELEKEYPGIRNLTATKDDLFDDEFDVVDLSIGDITIDFDDVISRNKLKKLWVEKTKGADKTFPDVKTADYDYLVDDDEDDDDKPSVSRLEYKSKYSKEALKAPKKKKGESAEDFARRKKEHKELKFEFEAEKKNWEEYVDSFGKRYPEYVENFIEDSVSNQSKFRNAVMMDFQKKMTELLKDTSAYDAKKVKSQYQSKKLAEMLVKNESMRKLLEEINREKLAPPQDKVDAKRKRVEKAVYLGLSGITLPTGGEEYSGEGKDRVFERAFDAIGRWIKDSNLRREFLDARSKNQSEVTLENEVEEYNDLINKLFDKKRVTHLRRRGIEPDKKFGSRKGVETEIRKYLSKEFGVKGIAIKQSGRDIIIEFSERSKTRQENIETVKRAMNAQARYESTPESGKVVAGRERKLQREAVAAYERISPKIRDLLKKLLYKGKVAKDAIDLSELFITKDSEWNGTSWDNPVVREDANGMEATEMMKELMDAAGEDRMKPPRKVKEIDVARRKGRFVQELSSKELRSGLKSTEIDTLVKNKPRYDTLRKTLVFLEDEIEDNVKLLDGRKKVKGARELIEAQLKSVANVVAYFEVSSKDKAGRSKYKEMKRYLEQLQKIASVLSSDIENEQKKLTGRKYENTRELTEARAKIDSKVQEIKKDYDMKARKIVDDFSQAQRKITSTIGEGEIKSPFRGSLKQDLISYGEKIEFDLENAIEETTELVEREYQSLEISEYESIIEEFDEVYKRIQDTVRDSQEE